ncbi:MAG: site-2 protease family protein [Deferrisomatales bacterium]|nr:site-2 protease family protein [Deferrisomatales bacterium]
MPQFSTLLWEIAIVAFPVLLAITFHEAAHGYAADRLGDPTARRAGRLSLNPLRHLDPAGTLVFVVTRMIGWAKPVPVNPVYFRHPRRDMLWVAVAGPAANLALAAAFAFVHNLLSLGAPGGRGEAWGFLLAVSRVGVLVNLGLGIFNLLPIPPLDGSRILAGILPTRAAGAVYRMERYGFVLLLLVVFSGALEHTLYPILRVAARALLGAPPVLGG